MANPIADLLGSAEVLGAGATGAFALPIAGAHGVYKTLTSGKLGSKEGVDEGSRAMAEALRRMTYAPRTESGQGQLEMIGRAFEASKIPPYSPIGGKITRMPGAGSAVAAEAANVAGPPLERMLQKQGMLLNAVKEPGGHISNHSIDVLRGLLTRSEAPHVTEWADKTAARYANRHMGTAGDPANPLTIGGETYERLMDRSVKQKPQSSFAQGAGAPTAGAEDQVWNFSPNIPLRQHLQHAGDIASQLEPRVLAKMDLPQLLKKVAEIDRSTGVVKAKSGDARLAAVKQQMEDWPGGPILQTPEANVMRIHSGMTPEEIKHALSVESCYNGVCIGGAGHGKPEWGYPGYVPMRDIGTGKPIREVYKGEAAANIRDSNSYADSIIAGKGSAYSIRDPESGLPLGTIWNKESGPSGVPRSFVRDNLMTPREYLRWQAAQRERGVPLEQRVQLPSSVRTTAEAGGGHIVPDRGMLRADQVHSLREANPRYAAQLDEYLKFPPTTMQEFRGYQNVGVHPYFAPTAKQLIEQEVMAGRLKMKADSPATGHLLSSGITKSGGDYRTLQELSPRINVDTAPHQDKPALRAAQAMLRGERPEPLAEATLARDPRLQDTRRMTSEESTMLNKAMRLLRDSPNADNPVLAPEEVQAAIQRIGPQVAPGNYDIPEFIRPRRRP